MTDARIHAADSPNADSPKPMPSRGVVATFSRGIADLVHLTALLRAERMVWRPGAAGSAGVDWVVGWGYKPSAGRAREYAKRHSLPYVRLEDGFLRSVGLSSRHEGPLSIVLDDQGMYYDAARPSRLEGMIAGAPELPAPERDALRARARRCIDVVVERRLSKYNHTPVELPRLPSGPLVMVVDQTAGDLSIARGLAGPETFGKMLRAALDENPAARIVIKTHPDVIAGKKAGHFSGLLGDPRIELLAAPANPIALVQRMERVYVCTSQLGFEALLAGKPVSCFGAPFYAGWGLTDDRIAIPRRGLPRTLEDVFAAAYIRYANYIDPESGAPAEIERVIEHLALQRAAFEKNRGTIYCVGFQLWKRAYIRRFLRSPGNRVVFVRDLRQAGRQTLDPNARVLRWGTTRKASVAESLSRHLGAPLVQMEDGFLRSAGLGSDLVAPASLVVDEAGIYYDPSAESELEQILSTLQLSADDRARAQRLRRAIVERDLSKYNVGAGRVQLAPGGRRVVLVPGQVEDDASIRLGCVDVRTNLGLLEAVRARRPDAFIVWKPHPDVTSGNRPGAIAEVEARRFCDAIVTDASLPECLRAVQELHTLTSLAGFEALLRGLPVSVYGRPFYAGWGLTEDRHAVERRARRLDLDELVTGVLIRYPRYVSMKTGQFTTPEAILEQLAAERDRLARGGVRAPFVLGPWRKFVHVWRGLTDAR
jgi:capsular polysaccharide export protein